ncbi:MAG: hypothetical protein ACYC8T_37875, partial [Myxococcaceae bacterium]
MVLDVPTSRLTGRVLLNGQPVTSSGICDETGSAVTIQLSGERGSFLLVEARCPDFNFDALVLRDRYRVLLGDASLFDRYRYRGTNLPGQLWSAPGSIDATSPEAYADFDVRTATVSGTLTINGADPSPEDCARGGWLRLATGDRAAFELPVRCENGRLRFDGEVYEGEHRARVSGAQIPWVWGSGHHGWSSFPLELSERLWVPAESPLVIDVPLAVVRGEVLENGRSPGARPCPGATPTVAAWVVLQDVNGWNVFQLPILCGDPSLRFEGAVQRGEYRVSVKKTEYPIGTWPEADWQAPGTLTVDGDQELRVDVQLVDTSVRVRLDGRPLRARCSGVSAEVGALFFG